MRWLTHEKRPTLPNTQAHRRDGSPGSLQLQSVGDRCNRNRRERRSSSAVCDLGRRASVLSSFFSHERNMGKLTPQEKSSGQVRAQVGHEVHKSTILRLLQRHGWRKPMPRPVHPQASAEVQEQFKKTSQPALRLPSRPVQQRTHDPS